MLRGDPALDAQPPHPVEGSAVVPAQLPPDVAVFTGRDRYIERLDRIVDDAAALVAITGMGGVGKTALAVHWAHRARDRFPDGQLYLDLHAYSPAAAVGPLDALGRLLGDLGVPAGQVPGDLDRATAAYRSLLAGKRVLVVCDNADHPDQVRPLLPPGPGSLALVTSRDRLSGLVAWDGARRVELDVLTVDEAVGLLARIVGDRA